jgi:hypothetical protein
VFPALQILRQARPPESNLEPIVASVEKLLASPHWHLRDMAARTVVSLRPIRQLYNAGLDLLSTQTESHNFRHGTLLAVKYMIRKLLQSQDALSKHIAISPDRQQQLSMFADPNEFGELLRKLSQFSEQWYIPSRCPFVRATYLDIVSLCGMAILRRPESIRTLPLWENLTSAALIGPQYALNVSAAAGDALLRQSLAQTFFIDRTILRENSLEHLTSKDYQGIDEALILLATEDQDTCCMALDTLDHILKLNSSNGITVPLDLVLAHVHRLLLHAADPEVISKAQDALANSLTSNILKTSFFNLLTEDQVFQTLNRLMQQCLQGPPSNMQSAIHLLGFFLDHTYSSCPTQRCSTLEIIARYVRLLRMTLIDTNPFDMEHEHGH